jgi:rhamnosyltransferase
MSMIAEARSGSVEVITGTSRSDEISRSLVAVIVPTCNASALWDQFSAGLRLQGLPPNQILIIDSDSEDDTRIRAAAEGYTVCCIDRRDFNHGGTRQLALDLVPWATIVYLTQDAVLATPASIGLLLSAFEDPRVGVAYGRQLPRPVAGPIEAHARLFNYPERSDVRDFESRHRLGIKATFLSNSFSAYRVTALAEVGGFPTNVIIAEDSLTTGRMLIAGWKAAYVAEAQVYHSHAFTMREEFRRYFDIGVCHRRESWLREQFGKPNGEGERFVLSELIYLSHRRPSLIPIAIIRTVAKALGYRLGLSEERLTTQWSKRLSYHKNFWNNLDRPSGSIPEPDKRREQLRS